MITDPNKWLIIKAMKDLKITKGEWRFAQVTMNQYVHCDGLIICNIIKRFEQETETVGELIADAGNTAQKCGLLPSELMKQRDELLEALKELVHLHGCEQEGLLSGQPTPKQWYKAVEKAEMVITNAEER